MINNFSPLICCSYCNERYPSGNFYREHLIMCENWIERCPHCRQTIRQSISVYPYENNSIKCNILSPRSNTLDLSISLTTNNDEIYYQKPRLTSQQSIRIREICSYCSYCGLESYGEDKIRHEEFCLMNPKNKYRSNNFHKSSYLFCKYCNDFIQSNYFNNHKISCEYNYYQQFKEEPRYSYEKSSDLFIRCGHCGVLFTRAGLRIHQINLKRCQSYHPNNSNLSYRRSFYT